MRSHAWPRLRFSSRPVRGAAFVPTDLAGLAAWYTPGPAWMFTDAGASVPCGVGDGIYTWVDRGPRAKNAVQATAANRLILAQVGGRHWAHCPAGDTRLARAAALSIASPDSEFFVRFRFNTVGSNMVLFALAVVAGTNAFGGIMMGGKVLRALRNGVADSGNAAPVTLDDTSYVGLIRGAGNTAWSDAWAGFMSVDGGTETAGSLGYAESQGEFQIGEASAGNMNLWIGDIIATDGPLTAGQRANVLSYLAAN